MDLKLYNSLSNKKEVFRPLQKGSASVYTCGPTVYDRAHLGNFRSYIFSDILIRALHFNGFTTKHIINITDVGHLTDDADQGEDKLERRAKKDNKKAQDISKEYTDFFIEDSKKLNLLPPNKYPRATDHIDEQIVMIQKLEGAGFTYKTSNGIYFDTSKLKDYGKLANLNLESLKEGARVEKNLEKKNPTDFALWKFSKKEENRHMEWDSPWGTGFPGWHIECSAMSKKYLGFPFDIHTGGIDHKPVHHTNEIAQNEALVGRETVNYWLHNGFMTIDEERMAKSLGNMFTVRDLEDRGTTPIAFRYFMLGAHYRSPINFTWQALKGAEQAYTNLILEIRRLTAQVHTGTVFDQIKNFFITTPPKPDWKKRFTLAINDDLNTPAALAVLWDTLKDKDLTPKEKLSLLITYDTIFGLNLKEETRPVSVPSSIKELVKKREEFRNDGNWNGADHLRDEINEKGFIVEDGEKGPIVFKSL
ncbi:cysteine--tRNA ligase [bacterium]|nr:cysteine--tRNA ligase [bacterium]